MLKHLMTGAVAALTLLAACTTPSAGRPVYQASVVRTRYGVPHVSAGNWAGLGFGFGYSLAQDNLCLLAQAMVTFRGERARYFGAEGKIPQESTLGHPTNLDSDFFFRQVLAADRVERFRVAQPRELQEMTMGFAAGISRYVREIQKGGDPGRHRACRQAEWLGEISVADVYRRMYALELASGSVRFLSAIATARPPNGSTAHLDRPASAEGEPPRDLGSNMMGFGREATGQSQGLLLGNPHWFWDSIDRFYQVHLQLPGQLDVEGAAIVGVPIVLIGFNRDIAWSHTVSTARRFTLYRLKLVEGDPTAYLYDGQIRHMEATSLTVQVRQPDGTVRPVTRTLYQSHYGPVLALGWTNTQAFALRDANLENFRAFRNWLRWDRAKSLNELIRIQKEEVAVPWVNTVAVARNDPRVWYADVGAIPNVSDAMMTTCRTHALGGPESEVEASALDGSTSRCEWQVDPASPQPGILPAERLPQLLREDYAANMNDSFWLANPNAPLTGYPRIVGAVDSEQSLRTRLGHILVRERLLGTDGLPGRRMTAEDLKQLALNSRSLSADLFLDSVLTRICPRGKIELAQAPGGSVDIGAACRVLRQWDRRGNNESRGAQIWDSFWQQMRKLPESRQFRIPFDPAAPLETPRELSDDAAVVDAFAVGVLAVQASTLGLDAPRADYQFLTDARGEHVPLAGGCAPNGYFTVVCSELTESAVSVGSHGNSYMQVVQFTQRGVEPYTLLLPSESTDPASPHFRDYTRAYSQKEWLRAAFTESEIRGAAVEHLQLQEPAAVARR